MELLSGYVEPSSIPKWLVGGGAFLGGWMPEEVVVDPFVEVNPEVLTGKPVMRGTRITVENILERLGAGETVEDILEAYPQLSPESIRGENPRGE